MAQLSRESLHASVADPVLETISFLNEVMSRHPQAVSFAPGAPHPSFVRTLDGHRYVQRYLDHLADTEGLGRERAQLLLGEYGPSRGLINGLVAAALGQDLGTEVPPQALVVTVGAQEAMFLVLRALFRSPSDLLAVTDPSFPGITGAARLLDIGVVPVPERGDGLDLDRLEAACEQARRQDRRIRLCYVAPDFANPSGSRMDLAARHRLLELAERADFLLLEDNVYGFTAAPGAELPALKSLDHGGRVVHVGSFAKICFPGARAGFVLADQEVRAADGTTRLLADEIAALKSMVTVNTSPWSQALVGGMLLEHGGSLRTLGAEKSRLYRRNLALLTDALDRHVGASPPPGVHWNRPDGGFFVRMTLPVPADAALLEVSAAKYGVLWTPMAGFHLDDTGDRVLRLSCSYLDPEQIETGVRRLAAFLRNELGS
ncbi:PLP-dependent aminotransferase family protein [Kitasatospora sp. MAP5-34]|uniref:aminotransferase-like domain-containing protein n=1 Tax=Kitasatospora sp. MAP5-34 TaxID=3035102 RepID=UPI0024751DAC|nr:PLP-dependent aminotransferase family protein [Kitasatospora sp. MAP5-34]MDH6578563.1 (S)-3,5-dihydroxyphenylglycine transaminase [Kitasatospora sp. MAP5-34]